MFIWLDMLLAPVVLEGPRSSGNLLEPLAVRIPQLVVACQCNLLGMCAGDIDSTLVMCIDDI